LADGAREPALRQRRDHQQAERAGAGGFAEHGDVAGGAAEGRDVLLHPLQRGDLIHDSVEAHGLARVIRVALGLERRMREKQIDLQDKVQVRTKQLQETEHLVEDLFSGAPDPIVILDRKGVLKKINPAVEKVIGYKEDELVGRHFLKTGTLTLASTPRVLQEFTLALAGEQRPPFVIELTDKQGRRLTFEAHAKMMLEGKWMQDGVWNMEQMDPDPFMVDMNKYGLPWTVLEDPGFDLV